MYNFRDDSKKKTYEMYKSLTITLILRASPIKKEYLGLFFINKISYTSVRVYSTLYTHIALI